MHKVGWLGAETGAQILADLAPAGGTAKDAAVLSERLGGLPLALHNAGSQLASDFTAQRTFEGYTRALDERFGPMMGHGAADDRATVINTWELSLDALAAKGRPQARPLMRVLSCLAPGVLIPTRLLNTAVLGRTCQDGPDGAVEGLDALASVGPITTSPDPLAARPGCIIHPLVAETSRLRVDAEGPAQVGTIVVALLTAAARLRRDRPRNWPAWVQLVPHLTAVYGYLASRLTDTDLLQLAKVTVSTAQAFVWAGSYLASQQLAESALQHVSRLGADHPQVLSLRFQVGVAHRFGGKYIEAEQEFCALLPGRHLAEVRRRANPAASRPGPA